MDAVMEQVRFARLVRLEHAAKEAACSIQIKRLRQSIKMKRDILRSLTTKRVSADQEVRSKLVVFREALEQGHGVARHPEALSSDFDITQAFQGVTADMLRNTPTPAPSPPGASRELPVPSPSPYRQQPYYVEKQNGSSELTLSESQERELLLLRSFSSSPLKPQSEEGKPSEDAKSNAAGSVTEYSSDDASPAKAPVPAPSSNNADDAGKSNADVGAPLVSK